MTKNDKLRQGQDHVRAKNFREAGEAKDTETKFNGTYHLILAEDGKGEPVLMWLRTFFTLRFCVFRRRGHFSSTPSCWEGPAHAVLPRSAVYQIVCLYLIVV
jgi:hypothetical protein